MLRVVFDTNVLVSSIIYVGKSSLLIDAVLEGKIMLITSTPIIREFRGVIARDKFKLSKIQQTTLTNFLLRICRIIKIKSRFKAIEGDPSDDVVLRTAVDGKADFIVSGDEHLLSLKEFGRVKIMTVSEILDLTRE